MRSICRSSFSGGDVAATDMRECVLRGGTSGVSYRLERLHECCCAFEVGVVEVVECRSAIWRRETMIRI